MHIGGKYLTLYTFGLDLLWFHSRLIVWWSIEIFYFSSLGFELFSPCLPALSAALKTVSQFLVFNFLFVSQQKLACKISYENMSCVWNVEDFLSIQIIPLFLIFSCSLSTTLQKKSHIYISSSCCVSPQQIRLWYMIPHSYTIW